MVKQQQMQWTPEGAHLLLQVRTQVLNDDCEHTCRRWYPSFRPVEAQDPTIPLAASYPRLFCALHLRVLMQMPCCSTYLLS